MSQVGRGIEGVTGNSLWVPDLRVATDLDVVKYAARERSVREGVLTRVGNTLADGTSPAIWKGSISLARRLESGELTEWHLQIAEQRLAEHYVPVSEDAAERCVDDRTTAGYRPDDPLSYGRPLGPQVQGGTVDEAVIHRLDMIAQGEDIGLVVVEGITLVKDVILVANRPKRSFRPGAHTGASNDPTKTGCGSVDEQTEKLKAYDNADAAEAIQGKTTYLAKLGKLAVEDSYFGSLRTSAAELLRFGSQYLDQNLVAALEALRDFGAVSVPHMFGPHGGFALGVNYVPRTTLHTDEYNVDVRQETGRDIMAFGLDAWHVIKEHPPETATKFIAQAVNTLTQLTDGSLRLYVRLPA